MQLRQISLNASGGAFVTIAGASTSAYVEAMEDEATSTQGLQVYSYEDGFQTLNTFSFGSEPIMLPQVHRSAAADARGQIICMPAQNSVGSWNYIPAIAYLKATSDGASGTVLRVTEYD